jgi:hypothetical protein
MRPTFSRFDIHDLFDTLPPFVRNPMALATMASVLAHGVIAVGLPVFAGSEEKKPERVVDVISLSPAEQGKLPSNSMMMPGGGLNGTAALPLPLTKNGTLSPLSGLSGSTLGSSGSPYSGVPGLLDPPIISYNQTSPTTTRTNSDSGFKKSSTKILFPGFDGSKADLKFDWSNQVTEQEADRTANKDQTPRPPGAPADNLPKLDTNQGNPPETQTPQKVATNNPGTLEEAGKKQQQGQPLQIQVPALTVAQALGQFSPGEKTKAVDQIALANAQSTTYADMFDSIAKLSNSKIEELIEQPTILRPQEITLSLPIPKTSDAIPEQQQPVPAEFILVLNPQGGLLTSPGPEGKPALKFNMVRETGYANLTQQAVTYMQTQNAVLQESINQQVKEGKLKLFDGKYSYLKIIVKPTAVTVTT